MAKPTAPTPPLSIAQLNERVYEIASALDVTVRRAQDLVCSLVVAQMLPGGVLVKGGVGLKIRMGESRTRATNDFDVAAVDPGKLENELSRRLEQGWGKIPATKSQQQKALAAGRAADPRVAFTGVIKALKPATPTGIPTHYVMQPYGISLSFLGRPWARVDLEVSHDEIGWAEEHPLYHPVSTECHAVMTRLACGDLMNVPIITLEQQIAQKIHAVTEPGSTRGHDLVDLQRLWTSGTTDSAENIDMRLLRDVCHRTFAHRRAHAWPPTVPVMSSHVEPRYNAALAEVADRTSLAPDVVAALGWLRERIEQIEEARK